LTHPAAAKAPRAERFGQTLPEGSYGRRNREAIAARETCVATWLDAVEHAYRTAVERGTLGHGATLTKPHHAPSGFRRPSPAVGDDVFRTPQPQHE
jgi:hypothetical protein